MNTKPIKDKPKQMKINQIKTNETNYILFHDF